MVKLGFLEKLTMLQFLQGHINEPDAIIAAYRKEPEKWDALKASFPVYEEYMQQYPELVKRLKDADIPL
jgi:hypothetical protein